MTGTGVFLAVLCAILVITALLGHRNRLRDAEALRRELADTFGKRSSEELSSEKKKALEQLLQNHVPDSHPGYVFAPSLDEITWNDLELDRIYAGMDTCRSGAGEWFLYAMLHAPAGGWKDLTFREEQLAWWGQESTAGLRIAVLESLCGTGGRGRFEGGGIRKSLEKARELSFMSGITALLLPAASLLLMLLDTRIGLILFLASLALNIVRYFRVRASIAGPLAAIAQMLRLARSTRHLPDLTGTPFAEEYTRIQTLSGSLASLGRGSSLLLREPGDPFRAVLDYLCMLLHLDLLLYIPVLKKARKLSGQTEELWRLLGSLDASLAIASWRKSLPVWCVPFPAEDETAATLSTKGLIHPLLSEPVPNDLDALKPVLLTGSNASGKSTFLKACALAAILGQTTGTVPAAAYTAPCFRIYTSMALRDSLRDGESYFIVEIRSLKRILDAADGKGPVLCCIDEVLRGTGTVERIAASTEILLELAARGVLCMAATHDGELCGLLEGPFENYHFSEELSEGDVRFSYRLRKGPSHTRNAIRLLGDLSYDRDLVEKAEQRAQAFLKEGKWER